MNIDVIDEAENEDGIIVQSIDELEDTEITIGCYRETSRLLRMLNVYGKALTLANCAGRRKEFKSSIIKLHDHKGMLTATWRSVRECRENKAFIEDAWGDENEFFITHKLSSGYVIEERTY